ncbi:hypothetical protein CYMTET_52694 [Cymbomonas tetramitiformis]|uniref:Uncharacterized protein n=1 Tax=Cymbomonas tetramitiformis TaxID=36881 RepID=A0AAE0BIS5_9CHLO|nr:hypothetical protein CYMTET_52694 [Cymbomonas tetramitiformis]
MYLAPWAPYRGLGPPPPANGLIEGWQPLSPESSEEELPPPPPPAEPPSIEPAGDNNFSNLDSYSDSNDNNLSLDFHPADIDSSSSDLRLLLQGPRRSG